MKNFIITVGILLGLSCSKKDLIEIDDKLSRYENSVYINRTENKKVLYRGIASTNKDAINLAFKELGEGKCPDKIELKQ